MIFAIFNDLEPFIGADRGRNLTIRSRRREIADAWKQEINLYAQ